MTFMIRISTEFDTKCCHPFCDSHADLYRRPDFESEEPTPVVFLCNEHAREFGYCWGCGHYWGGVESFDFGPGSKVGLCEECHSELTSDNSDEDDNDDDDIW